MQKQRIVLACMIIWLVFVGSVSGQEPPGNNRVLHVWEAATGNRTVSIPTDEFIWDAGLNWDGTRLIAALEGGIVRVYELDGRLSNLLVERTFSDTVGFPALAPSLNPDQWFVFRGSTFWLWDMMTDEVLLSGAYDGDYAAPMSPDGSQVLTYAENGINVYSLESGELTHAIETPRVWDVQWSPDSSRIAVAHNEGYAVFDAATGEALINIQDERFSDVYSRVHWSPDGATLLTVASPSLRYEDTVILVLDGATLKERLTIPFDAGVFDVNWSADSTRFITAAYEPNGVRVFDANTGDLLQTFSTSSTPGFLTVDWTQGETRVVAAVGGTDDLAIWDQSEELLGRFSFTGSYQDVIWNPDHSAILAGGYPDSIIDVYDLISEEITPISLRHADNVLGRAWSGDGNWIVTWTGELRG